MQVRAGDLKQHYFRSDRYFQSNGQWHFATREQTIEGPYPTRAKAEAGLARYVELICCRLFNASEQNTINSLKIMV